MAFVRPALGGTDRFRRKVKPKRVDREGPIQESIVRFVYAAVPGVIVHHCKNEMNRSGKTFAREIAKAVRRGLRKGFPDLMILLPGSRIFFLEVKAPGNYPDKDQRELHDEMRALGFKIAVVRGIDDLRAIFNEWGIETREK